MFLKNTQKVFQGNQRFKCLGHLDVMTAQVSDHYPVIHQDTLFWNVMMQCKNSNGRFNNGFGLIENDKKYLERLKKIAAVIAEIYSFNPHLKAITLCEGPIKDKETHFLNYLQSHHLLKKNFFNNENPVKNENYFTPTDDGDSWGLLTFIDRRYNAKKIDDLRSKIIENKLTELNNRTEVLELKNNQNHEISYLALVHLPFKVIKSDLDSAFAYKTEQLSALGSTIYKHINDFISDYASKDLTIAGDFNFRPHLLDPVGNGIGFSIPNYNSRLLFNGWKKAVTVDGILVSQQSRQKIVNSLVAHGLFSLLKQEHSQKSIYSVRRD